MITLLLASVPDPGQSASDLSQLAGPLGIVGTITAGIIVILTYVRNFRTDGYRKAKEALAAESQRADQAEAVLATRENEWLKEEANWRSAVDQLHLEMNQRDDLHRQQIDQLRRDFTDRLERIEHQRDEDLATHRAAQREKDSRHADEIDQLHTKMLEERRRSNFFRQQLVDAGHLPAEPTPLDSDM